MKDAFADALTGLDEAFSSVEEALLSVTLAEIRKGPAIGRKDSNQSGTYRLARGTREMALRQAPEVEAIAPDADVPVLVRMHGIEADLSLTDSTTVDDAFDRKSVEFVSVVEVRQNPSDSCEDQARLASEALLEVHQPDLIIDARGPMPQSEPARRSYSLGARDFASLLLASVLLTLGLQYLLTSAGVGPG